MSPHLTDLNGNPMTWEELNRRNAEWHETHDEYGSIVLPPLPEPEPAQDFYSRELGPFPIGKCYECSWRKHRRCTGMARAPRTAYCGCSLNGHAA